MYPRILLAADGSENAVRAAREAAKIASLTPETVVEILYVADMDKAKKEVLHAQSQDELDYKRRQKLVPIVNEFASKNVTNKIKIITGDPGPAIVEYANKEKVDLVILGSRGLNALQEFVLGSVSHKVVKRAQCPVMIVK
ncbi:universal stress protein [Paenibacillus sp. 1P07SE]|uniref:universal stress protein n=1 Tax=Paenibacillus sp. 1P07SE TaxID=3132209 RepID=UPI0039A5AA5B